MRSEKRNVEKTLDQALTRHGQLTQKDVDAALDRAWESLQPDLANASEWRIDSPSLSRRPLRLLGRAAIAAALAVVAVVIVRTFVVSPADPSIANTENNHKIRINEIVRAFSGMTLALADGSGVEMRADSELWFEPADDGIRIRLNKGGVIVDAAKRSKGHLYVQTKDLVVSVVGTVFLVGTGEAGSRVGVIQGEVRVQQGETQRTLRPGTQLVSGLGMPPVPLQSEISWSPRAPSHIAMLRQEASPLVRNPDSKRTTPLKFDTASIKHHSGAPNGESLGFVCRGSDRTIRSPWGLRDVRLGPVIAPQGRCVGKGVLLSNLIGFAYETFPKHVVNLPDWAVPPDPLAPANAFQIEALAGDASTVTAEQLREMVRTLLAERFRLQVHSERQESPGYLLVAGKNGAKVKLKETSDPEESPATDAKMLVEERRAVLKGKSTLDDLAQWIGSVLGVVVVNKTDRNGIYDYTFPLIHGRTDEHEGRTGPPTPVERAAEISELMEETIGLKLQSEKAIPVQMIVVDHVERPSEN